MIIRRIRIWLSRGWYRVVYSVSFLVLSFLCSCSSSKTVAKDKTVGNKGVESSKDNEPADSAKTDVSVINMEDFQGLGIETPDIRLMYGVPRPVLERKQIAPQETAKSNIVVSGSKPQAGDIISGVVRGENDPIQMANITERDSLYRIVAHAVSDVNGKFAFRLVNPADRLSVTFVGYGEAITDITGTSFEVTMVELPDLPMVDIRADRYVTMYGPPAVNYNRNYDPNAQPAVRDFIEIGARTPDVSVMYGVPVNRSALLDNAQTAEASAPKYPLILLDGEIVSVGVDKLSAFVFGAPVFDRYELADLAGIRGDKIKAVQSLDNKEAAKIWGDKGAGGSLEILTRKYYRKARKAGKLSGHNQPLTGLKNR